MTCPADSAAPLAVQNACKRAVGSCLGNQLSDMAAADTARAAKGSTPLYFITRYGGGNTAPTQAHSASHSDIEQQRLR